MKKKMYPKMNNTPYKTYTWRILMAALSLIEDESARNNIINEYGKETFDKLISTYQDILIDYAIKLECTKGKTEFYLYDVIQINAIAKTRRRVYGVDSSCIERLVRLAFKEKMFLFLEFKAFKRYAGSGFEYLIETKYNFDIVA